MTTTTTTLALLVVGAVPLTMQSTKKFQFQLIAKLPAGRDEGRAYDYYDKYTVCFNDTLSEGITYDGLDSVVIESNGTPYDITNDSSKYDIDISNLKSQNSFVVKNS